jgi:putative transposase
VGAIECANLSILKDALRNVPAGLDERVLKKALRKLEQGSCALYPLARALKLKSPAVLLRLIATQKLHACLEVQYLANVYTARVYATQSEACEFTAAFQTVSNIEQILLNGSIRTSSVTSDVRANIRTLAVDALSNDELHESLGRLQRVEAVLKLERAADRTERRWLKRMREGVAAGKSPAEAIASRAAYRGNEDVRLTNDQLACAKKAINEFWLTHVQPSMRATWLAIEWPKDTEGREMPISYARFCELCDEVEDEERERKRGGHRAAQSVLPASHPADRSAMPTRAWEWCQVDSTPADIKVLVDLGLEKLFLRLTLAILVDAFTKFVLAFWLSFGGPKRDMLSMLYRMCARRHGRLPNGILYDHGSENDSTFNETFLASLVVDKAERPVELPRYASEVENCLGVVRQKLFCQLAGNMQNDQRGRSASPSHKAHNTTRFVISSMYDETNQYFDHFNTCLHGKDRFTPTDAMQESVSTLGDLATRVPFDSSFIVNSAIPADRKTYPIDARRGIRIGDGEPYWNDAFKDSAFRHKRAEVKREPFDPSIIYARCNDRWLVCCSSDYQRFKGLSDHERLAEAALVFDAKSVVAKVKLEQDREQARHQMNLWKQQQESEPVAKTMPSPTAGTRDDRTRSNEPDFASLRTKQFNPLRRES